MANWPEYKKLNLILLSALALSVLALATFAAFFYDISHLIIVHFDAFSGIDFLGTKYDVFLICGVIFAIMFINFLLARALFIRDKFLSWSLALGSLALAIISFTAILVIVFNN